MRGGRANTGRALLLLASAATLALWGCRDPAEGAAHVAGDLEDDDEEGGDEGERSSSLADLPEAARVVVLRVAGACAIEEVEELSRGGVTVYEAEFRAGGRERSVLVSASGELIETREVVPADRVPAGVRASVEQALPGGVIEEVEAVHPAGAEAPVRYDIEVKRGGRTRSVTVPTSPP